MASIQINDEKYEKPITYYMEDWVKHNIDLKVKPALQKKDKDFLICIDGAEGAGKSWLALQLGKYIDPTLDLSRVVFNPEEFREAILKGKKGQVIIYDEAFTGLSSRASLSIVNRSLVSLMMQMRQKNLCIILVLPTFFLLDKYAALFRAKVLFHVYENKGIRGYFKCYSRKLKKLLYLMGKNDYSYPKQIRVPRRMRGRFYGIFALGDEKMEEKYRTKKGKALADTEKSPMTSGQVKYREQRDVFIYLLRKQTDLTYEQIGNLLMDYDIELSWKQIAAICARFGDKGDKRSERQELMAENSEKQGLIAKKDEELSENSENIGENEYFEPEIDENEQKE